MQIFLFMLSFMRDIFSTYVTFINCGTGTALYKYLMCLHFHLSFYIYMLSSIYYFGAFFIMTLNMIFCFFVPCLLILLCWSWFSILSILPTFVPSLENQWGHFYCYTLYFLPLVRMCIAVHSTVCRISFAVAFTSHVVLFFPNT